MKRFIFLDVLRGFTVALMVIVNSPGNCTPFSTLEHSTWHGCTIADLVFPFFIIIVGISSVLSMSSSKQKGSPQNEIIRNVFKRTLIIFALGLALNAFPHHFDFDTIRWYGVLQRIAICYFISALLCLRTSIKVQAFIFVVLLVTYPILLIAGGNVVPFSLEGNLVGVIDRLIFASSHLYLKTFDPEGLLSTLPAIASVLLGNLIGFLLLNISSPTMFIRQTLVVGFLFMGIALVLNQSVPINKSLWTSSYVLWSGGCLLVLLSLTFYLIEECGYATYAKPLTFLGRHALFVYCLHVFLLKVQAMIKLHLHGEIVNLRVFLSDTLYSFFPMKIGSLLYSISFLLFCTLFTALFFRVKQKLIIILRG